MAAKFGGPMPWEGLRWMLAEATGWHLEYIDGLDINDVYEWLYTRDGQSKAR